MGDSYEKVKERERVEALRERAQIIVEAERRHPSRHNYHEYMHFVEAADSSGPAPQEWEGITGRMKQLLQVQGRRTDEVEEKIEQVDEKLDHVDEKLDNVENKIDDKIGEVKAEMRKINSLLCTLVDKVK